MKRRLAMGQISHETNAFSPIRTGIQHFEQRSLARGRDMIGGFGGTRTPLGGFIHHAADKGWELCPTISASAVPSGLVFRDAYDQLLAALLDGIREAGEIDGVLLALHGAMVVEGIADAEGDILSRVRQLVGPGTPVVATLDYHANVSDLMVEKADGLFGYNTYPHVDGWERGVEAAGFIGDLLDNRIQPVSVVVRPRLAPGVVPARTGWGPVRKLMEKALAHEDEPGVVNVSVYGGFVYSDIPDAGVSFVVTTDGDLARAQEIAGEMADAAWDMRREFRTEMMTPDRAVASALAEPQGPVVLADVADNTGGGASGDGTEILRALLDQKAKSAVVITMPDPQAVDVAFAAGVGGGFDALIGGKIDERHGAPVPVRGQVRLLSDGRFVHRGPMATGVWGSMGRTAVVETGGIEIILTERRFQPVDPEVARSVGIDPARRKIVVLKSSVHYRASYEPIASRIVEVDGPGLSSPNLSRFSFANLRRPVFPLDDL